MTIESVATQVNKMDTKLDQIIKEVKKLRDTVDGLDGGDSGMTYLMGSEISEKLSQIIQLLQER